MDPGESGGEERVWTGGDSKAVQCLTDIFTSVFTTCDVPENALFGPCVLSHTTLYDSIAFIALKSTDKRTAPYIFRVDTSAASSSAEGVMWLRLVQSARDPEEQNLEAYVKNGQLFYRSLRRVHKDEELLVWYGRELLDLLGLCLFSPGSTAHTCPDCSQRFLFDFPFLSHLRFRCTKRLQTPPTTPTDTTTDPRPPSEGVDPSGPPGGGTPGRSSPKPLPGPPDAIKDPAHPGPAPPKPLPLAGSAGGGQQTPLGTHPAPPLLHLPLPARAELVRKVQRVLPHDVGPGVPHALAPQEGVRRGAAGAAAARGEAPVSDLQRGVPRAASPVASHDVA
uniref:PR domain containing 8b n=1 Tax=Gadus morhua TaxID=8049 RepID=A0A8C5CAV5_GADMO